MACVPERLVPIFCGALQYLEQRSEWATQDDWEQGSTWIVGLQADLMTNCIQQLIDEQQRLYRLLDTALNGTVYEVVDHEPGTNRPIIAPEIPDVPDQPVPMTFSLRPGVHRMITALDGGEIGVDPVDNILTALRGDEDATAVRNLADLLITIRDKLIEADPDDDSLLEEIRKLLV